MKSKFLIIILAGLGLFASCDRQEPDVTSPVIHDVHINDKDHDIAVNAGSSMTIEVHISDDRELQEYKLDIHDDFDGHGHGKLSGDGNTPFNYSRIIQISGTNVVDNHTVDIPSNAAAGPYHLTVRALDAEGNESNTYEVDFTILQEGQPVIAISSPVFDDLHYNHGDTIFLTGNVTSQFGLHEVHIEVHEYDDHGHGKMNDFVIYDEEFELNGANEFDFNELINQNKPIVILNDTPDGYYEIKITAKDEMDNRTIRKFKFHVH